MKAQSVLLGPLFCTIAFGYQSAPSKPEAFLKWSMDRYKALPSFKAKIDIDIDFGGGMVLQERTVLFQAPNRFKVVSSQIGSVQTSVCDGTRLVEYSTLERSARSYGAPDSISDARSMQMQQPWFNGSLLYQFFAGSANYNGLVDVDKGPINFGGEEVAQGEKCRVVRFHGPDSFGRVQALIGEKTGKVYRLRYGTEPLIKTKSDPKMKTPSNETVESYSDINSPKVFLANTFSVALPSGMKVRNMGPIPSLRPPVPIGSAAPEFVVTKLDGKPVRLSSFRGHVVFIDFWASWCPPCYEGLLEAERVAKLGAKQGLKVLTISNDGPAIVSYVVKKKNYTFPTYCDTNHHVVDKYKIHEIPVTMIIDREGKLRSYMVGLHPPAEVESALRKVGIKVN